MKIFPVNGNINKSNSAPQGQNTQDARNIKPNSSGLQSRHVVSEKEPDQRVPVDTEKKIDEEILQEGTQKLNEMTRIFDRSFHFEIHEESKRWMVQVINTETGEVIKEIPPEKILDMVARLDQFVGLVIDERR